jgi:GTP-binding protein EngB required for normal cell division
MRLRCVDHAIRLVQTTSECLRSGAIAVSPSLGRGVGAIEIARELEEFRERRLVPIWHRWRVAEESPYVMALVGLTNVGKSTILQALLKAEVAPRGNRPMTSVPIWYRFAEEWEVELAYKGARFAAQRCRDASEVQQLLLKQVSHDQASSTERCCWIRVCGPMHVLRQGLELVDTPGFGAAQSGQDDGAHQRRLDEFLRHRVHRIYFCVAAASALVIKDEEAAYFQRLRDACGHVIVNKWNGTADERAAYVARHQGLFTNAEFIFVEARRAVRRVLQGIEHPEGDGIDHLESIIEACASPANRVEACMIDLVQAWRDIHRHLSVQLGLKRIPWQEFERERMYQALKMEASPLSAELIRIGVTP